MTELGYCPRFHTAITADAPAGLCPSNTSGREVMRSRLLDSTRTMFAATSTSRRLLMAVAASELNLFTASRRCDVED